MKLEQIPRRHCSKMDVGKDRSHLKRHQTPEPPLQKSYAPGKDRPSELGLLGRYHFSLFQLFGYWSDERSNNWLHPREDGSDSLSCIWMLRTKQSRETQGANKEIVSKKFSEMGDSRDTLC